MNPSSASWHSETRLWADRLGAGASILCVLHCLLTPVLMSASAVLAHLLPGEESTHRTLAVAVALFGAVALIGGFRRHRRSLVLVLLCAGLAMIAGAAWFGDRLPHHACEVAVTFAGSCCLIVAHRLNHTFCGQCACAGQGSGQAQEPTIH